MKNEPMTEVLTNELMERYIKALEQNTAAVNRLAEVEELKHKRWLNPDEACRMLGFPVNGDYNHRRKLQWLREQGYLTKFQDTRPMMYWTEDVSALAEKIALGKVQVPYKWKN